MLMYDLILKKRDGGTLNKEEIQFFVDGVVNGTIPDYQISSMLMAIYFNGMTHKETAELTLAMEKSGDVADLSGIKGIKVDKHSTGGVGDKTTMMVTPVVAAAGIPVAKMSGKGMGHACGTVDKLDSFPGMQTAISSEEFIKNVNDIGISVIGQSGNFVPADKYIYALRAVTGTVESIPLIASSIMSKKLAAGADRILLDVKTGSGAFMKTYERSVELAKEMVEIGRNAGRKTGAIVSDMDVPLGTYIGNALEAIEAMEVLKGRGSKELTDFCIFVAARMLNLADMGTIEECEEIAKKQIESGAALEKFRQLIERQGGDVRAIDDYTLLGVPKTIHNVVSPVTGYISHMETDQIGMAGVVLGAGRATKDEELDYRAGIILHKKTGDFVEKGDVIAELHTNRDAEAVAKAEEGFLAAITFTDEQPAPHKLIFAYIDEDGITEY